MCVQVMHDDSLKAELRRRQQSITRYIVSAAQLISEKIDRQGGYSAGFDWCVEQLRTENKVRLANEVELAKASKHLGNKQFEEAVAVFKVCAHGGRMCLSAATGSSDWSRALCPLRLALHVDVFIKLETFFLSTPRMLITLTCHNYRRHYLDVPHEIVFVLPAYLTIPLHHHHHPSTHLITPALAHPGVQEFEKKEPRVKARAATNLAFLYVLEGNAEGADKYADMALKTDRYNARAFVNKVWLECAFHCTSHITMLLASHQGLCLLPVHVCVRICAACDYGVITEPMLRRCMFVSVVCTTGVCAGGEG